MCMYRKKKMTRMRKGRMDTKKCRRRRIQTRKRCS